MADMSRSSVNALVEEGRVQIDGTTIHSRRTVLRLGQELRVRSHPEVAAATARCRPGRCLRAGPCRPGRDRGGQAGRAGGPPGAGPPDGHAGPRAAGPVPRAPLGGRRGGRRPRPTRASCTGSTGARRASWWWPARADSYRSLVHQLGERRRVAPLPGAGPRRGGGRVGDGRRAGGAVGQLADPDGGVPNGQGGPDPLPRRAAVLPAGSDHPADGRRSRPAGPIRSESTSRPSATRWWATRSTARAAPCPVRSSPRPFLHAYSLAFEHPRTGRRMSWASSLPEDLRVQLDGLSS